MKNWDIAISHFVNIDHAGHKFGTRHPIMKHLLQQLDDLIK